MENRQKTVLALLVGAAVGAGVGLLYAPSSGREFRRKVGESTRGAQERAGLKFKNSKTSFSDGANKVLSKLESRVEETLSSASMKADDILESLEHKLEELRKQNKKFQKNGSPKMNNKDTAIASENNTIEDEKDNAGPGKKEKNTVS